MKKFDVGQAIGIVANIGVLIGVFLLVAELNQNSQMMRAQARNALADTLITFMTGAGANGEVQSLYVRGGTGELTDPDSEASELDRARYFSLVMGWLTYMENVHYQYRNGLYDEAEFAAQRARWARVFEDKGFADIWCRSRVERSPELVREIDALLTSNRCD